MRLNTPILSLEYTPLALRHKIYKNPCFFGLLRTGLSSYVLLVIEARESHQGKLMARAMRRTSNELYLHLSSTLRTSIFCRYESQHIPLSSTADLINCAAKLQIPNRPRVGHQQRQKRRRTAECHSCDCCVYRWPGSCSGMDAVRLMAGRNLGNSDTGNA